MYSNSAATLRRLNNLHRILSHSRNNNIIQRNLVDTRSPQFVEGKLVIDNVSKEIKPPKNPELVPTRYLNFSHNGNIDISQGNLHHLRWMLQKDQLGQDMFLIGRPGPMRRHIAMQYLQLTQRELEYVSLSRDTTESDLKQRREIQDGSAVFFDQCAVRAAVEGRVLVIEGVEKAERNVLPILNNLLENREMHLENGKLLIPAERYDKLLNEHGKDELNRWGLIRVSEDFRVIALGLPVPRYRGAPLDPPLRSRFQAREIGNLSYQEMLYKMVNEAPNVETSVLKKIATFCSTISATESNLPDFPVDNLHYIAKILNKYPSLSVHSAIYRLYPYNIILSKDGNKTVKMLLQSLDINSNGNDYQGSSQNIDDKPEISKSGNVIFVKTDYQTKILNEILQSMEVSDVCIIGPKGSGKSALINQLSIVLNRKIVPMVLYQDMIVRDFIQQRTTNISGDTKWMNSPLIEAARLGHIVVLDGIHRVHSSALSFLHRLVHDREIHLYDGTRLLRHDKYEEILKQEYQTESHLNAKNIFSIHPNFRIIALAESPSTEKGLNWITPEILSLFLFHEIRYLNKSEEQQIIKSIYGIDLKEVVDLAHLLRDSKDPIVHGLSAALSTRQILRIAQKLSSFSVDKTKESSVFSLFNGIDRNDQFMANLYDAIQRAFLSKFLPPLPKAALTNSLKTVNISSPIKYSSDDAKIIISDDKLKIGQTETQIYKTDAVTKVPDILFYDVPQHVQLMECMMQDIILGNHILLVGNQGVGKNKIADRLLQLMNRPREYIQLHRDTTVQTLTLQPSIRDGIVYYEDSPLVKAAKYGHTLVVDEADKAPTHVTCILKTLVEDGEMYLSDGRKILPFGTENFDSTHTIIAHPDFRIIVLANRPGFPFLGNDFFAALGDLFSCYAVDNPSIDSEIFLLEQYGPDVPRSLLVKFVNAFAELRLMADSGQLNYPYSTREVVNIVKHLQTYPNEDLSELIGNVLDFDRFSPESLEQVVEVLQRHGIVIETYAKNELAALRRSRDIQITIQDKSGKDVSGPKHGKEDPNNDPHVGGNTWAGGTGGRDTAGLGGKGGPYRLDKGHKIHQLSDEEKADIPPHVQKAINEMNRKAFEDKLKEIKMSKYDHGVYEQYRTPVSKQIQQLRIILNSLQAKTKERHWVRHRTSGDLDDGKLIEGITGEKNIYRMRTEQDPEIGQVQDKPKRLRLLVDVSGSMYRFNGYDARLERELELVVMMMEAFQGFESRVLYDIVGHSGESHNIPFVHYKNPPNNDNLRLQTIKMMHAHSQFCWSGDNTVTGVKHSVDTLSKEDCDEAIVVAISDANLSRYGIPPKKLAEALSSQEPKVQAYVIFIGSLDNEAAVVTKMLPAGKSFVCMELDKLPQILGHIFASSVLRIID